MSNSVSDADPSQLIKTISDLFDLEKDSEICALAESNASEIASDTTLQLMFGYSFFFAGSDLTGNPDSMKLLYKSVDYLRSAENSPHEKIAEILPFDKDALALPLVGIGLAGLLNDSRRDVDFAIANLNKFEPNIPDIGFLAGMFYVSYLTAVWPSEEAQIESLQKVRSYLDLALQSNNSKTISGANVGLGILAALADKPFDHYFEQAILTKDDQDRSSAMALYAQWLFIKDRTEDARSVLDAMDQYPPGLRHICYVIKGILELSNSPENSLIYFEKTREEIKRQGLSTIGERYLFILDCLSFILTLEEKYYLRLMAAIEIIPDESLETTFLPIVYIFNDEHKKAQTLLRRLIKIHRESNIIRFLLPITCLLQDRVGLQRIGNDANDEAVRLLAKVQIALLDGDIDALTTGYHSCNSQDDPNFEIMFMSIPKFDSLLPFAIEDRYEYLKTIAAIISFTNENIDEAASLAEIIRNKSPRNMAAVWILMMHAKQTGDDKYANELEIEIDKHQSLVGLIDETPFQRFYRIRSVYSSFLSSLFGASTAFFTNPSQSNIPEQHPTFRHSMEDYSHIEMNLPDKLKRRDRISFRLHTDDGKTSPSVELTPSRASLLFFLICERQAGENGWLANPRQHPQTLKNILKIFETSLVEPLLDELRGVPNVSSDPSRSWVDGDMGTRSRAVSDIHKALSDQANLSTKNSRSGPLIYPTADGNGYELLPSLKII